MKKVISVMVFVGMVLLTKPVQAQVYYFTQSGFDGGGTISGTFTGVDSNIDGSISSDDDEVSGYTLSFTGNSFIGGFTHSYANFIGLIYTVGNGEIGSVLGDGIGSEDSENKYVALMGIGEGMKGAIMNWDNKEIYYTPKAVIVSTSAPAPEPSTWALMGIGGLLAAFRLRKSAITSALSV